MSKIFKSVPVQVPNKSGFDLSHKNLFTAPVGTLVPVLCSEVLPNDTVTLGVQSEVQLPPLAADFYGRVDFKYEAFFVPNRILWGGWQDFITTDPVGDASQVTNIPKFNSLSIPNTYIGPGTLSDFLGFKVVPASGSSTPVTMLNPLKLFAYHKIWDDYYRDSRVQRSCFSRTSSGTSAGFLPFARQTGVTALTSQYLADTKSVFALRQRNWARDYFTNATPNPQAGADPASVDMEVHGQVVATDLVEGSTSFTIAALRAANALQMWLERNNIAGYRYGDQMKAQFGIYPADAATQRAIYLGSYTQEIYKKGVYQSNTQSSTSAVGNNPFFSVGSKYGDAVSFGDGSLIDKFTASEHGFIFVMGSLVPHATYSTGTSKDFTRNTVGDFAFPLLAGVGDQVIKLGEILNEPAFSNNEFGYTQRYSEYKFMLDEVHGLLRDDAVNGLSAFALQRSFDSDNVPVLGSAFLEIPQDYLDQVSAASGTKVSKYGCWVDANFVFKKSSTLPAYSIPTLSEPKDTHTEIIPNGGTRL